MAANPPGLSFYPLYWTHHDQWKYWIPLGNGLNKEWDHWGHTHFWMMGFDYEGTSGDAFHGQQTFDFEVKDIWGPRSQDPNQTDLYRVIGTPKWFFHVQEVWRRVFIQPWDTGLPEVLGHNRLGIKFDASPPDKLMGPFREGRANHGQSSFSPVWIPNARSLPIEYFKSVQKSQVARDNYVAAMAKALVPPDQYNPATYDLQHGNYLQARKYDNFTGHPAGAPPFSDAFYIWPIIEYQKVVQLNWEPLPGSSPDVVDLRDAGADYGDGWATQLTIPFRDPTTQNYRSPFANEPGKILEFGKYNETILAGDRQLVPAAQRLKYSQVQYGDGNPQTSLGLPASKSEQPVADWHNPYQGHDGGRVVAQPIGGIIQARCRIILEHKMGSRHEVSVESTQYVPTTPFEGTDQNLPG